MKKKKIFGFTLMELMVITAIVGILVMLLAPGLQATRRKAHEAECVNNIRQLAQAAIIFADEHDGVTPDVAPSPSGADISLASSNYIKTDKVFLCPSDPRSKDEFGSFPTSYTAFADTPTTMLPSGLKGMNCEAVLYIESARAGISSRSDIDEGDISAWHRDRTVIAFADGHAESIKHNAPIMTAFFGHGIDPDDSPIPSPPASPSGTPVPTSGPSGIPADEPPVLASDPDPAPASNPPPTWPAIDPWTPPSDNGIPQADDGPDVADISITPAEEEQATPYVGLTPTAGGPDPGDYMYVNPFKDFSSGVPITTPQPGPGQEQLFGSSDCSDTSSSGETQEIDPYVRPLLFIPYDASGE